ncbi:SCP2 sterol-binding domain-containing protein [Marinobacter bryozoorum]|uniref:ubiquinone anaerobic biosynthesis accessory factor UbiT n=1 Tax=Marinobacter bryozoorum TaxID=256324 RepID=UPI002006CA77|nr:SCP2 sterol-binding domain-containing protein [Marinobacter bryozoorum]MCK7543778.1 SCP2 sterol-binding domain-containing protein [Marinobacter bryozoorum]
MLPALPKLTVPESLLLQCQHALQEYAPSPAPMIRDAERRVPFLFKQLITEATLNRMFAQAIHEGEFDDFEGRTLRLEINGGQPGVTLGFWQGRLRIVEGEGEATIRGGWSAFYKLANRKLDPDQLFFQRKLIIEGNTELGLGIKNLLDSLEWRLIRAPAKNGLRKPVFPL